MTAVVQLLFVTLMREKPRSAAILEALIKSLSYKDELSCGSDMIYALIWLFDWLEPPTWPLDGRPNRFASRPENCAFALVETNKDMTQRPGTSIRIEKP